MEKIILDTDPGIDDALAILLAFSSPELRVEAVTTVAGNVSHAQAHINAKKLLEFMGKSDIPICVGAEKPLLREVIHSEDFHGKTGLGEAILPEPVMPTHSLNAVEMITRKADELKGELQIVAVGPLTNIASSILADPGFPGKIDKLVIMGGAYHLTPYGYGNANAVAEFNVWNDPEAAKIVFNAGIHIVSIGLDVTRDPKNRLSRELFQGIRLNDGKRAKLVFDLCRSLVERFDGCSIHDPMALSYLIDPSIFRAERYKVDVETTGDITRGMTVVDRRYSKSFGEEEANMDVVVDVDGGKFLNMFLNRVVGGKWAG